MKDHKLPLLRVLLSAVFLLCIAWHSTAQSNPELKQFTIIKNTLLIDTIESLSLWAPNPTIVYNGSLSPYELESSQPIGNGKFEIVISFDEDYVGEQNIVINYWEGGFNIPRAKFMVYQVNVVPSIVTAKDDIVVKTADTLTLLPLSNDYSNSNSHSVLSINQVRNGQASLIGDTINYIGYEEEDIILYSIQDTFGSVDQGVIYLTKDDVNVTGSSTIDYTILNTQSKLLLLPNTLYSVSTDASNGSVSNLSGQGFEYKPNGGFSGMDEIVFTDGNGNEVTYNITVLETVTDLGYIKNDLFNTAIGQAITFDVYSNDLVKSGALIQYSPELQLVSPGVFTYTPPANFQGTVQFTYKKNFGVVVETGTIRITVGNFAPTKAFPYEFTVLQGKDFLVEYVVPIDGYSFNIVNSPAHGVAHTFAATDTVLGQCASVTNMIGLNYVPSLGYTGYDEFDIEYCINNGSCVFYKLRFNVVAPVLDSLCNCIENCIWEGDANADGRVSVTDLLSIGRYMGHGGQTRVVAEQGIWNGNEGANWFVNQLNGKNTKHIDGNNDGVISEEDVESIVTQYGKVHSLVPTEVLAVKDYPFYLIPNETELDSGDLLVVQIGIGSENYPVRDAHGLTFSFNVNPSLIDSASANIEFYENTWFTDQSPTLDLAIHKSEGKIDVGYTRTTGVGVSGAGIIGQLSFIVEEDVHGIKANDLLEKIRHYVYLQNGTMEDMFGNRFALPDAEVGFDILLNKGGKDFEGKLVVFPNPAQDQITLHFNGRNTINDVVIYDMTGRNVYSAFNINEQHIEINSSQFNEGIYILQCATNQGTITKRVSITR